MSLQIGETAPDFEAGTTELAAAVARIASSPLPHHVPRYVPNFAILTRPQRTEAKVEGSSPSRPTGVAPA